MARTYIKGPSILSRFKINPKTAFFNSKAVREKLSKETHDVFIKFGAYVRRTAKQSIKKRKRISRPGRPPSSHTGLLKHGIFFVFDWNTESVVIGPQKIIGKKGEAPNRLEYGGMSQRHDNPQRRTRCIGDVGIVAMSETGSSGLKNAKKVMTFDGKFVWVVFGKLRSFSQKIAADKMEQKIYGPKVFGGHYIKPRSYMHPAAKKNLHVLPAIWKRSVR